MATHYRKTAKGQAEIETRVHRLLPRLRTALILVDGRRDDSELRKLVPGDADEAFRTLLADGFIEVTEPPADKPAARPAAARPAAPRPAPAEAPAAAAAPKPAGPDPKAFDNHRRAAVRALNEKTGPMGESIALKLEKARNWDELLPALQLAQRAIANAAGGAAAAEFGARFVERPPG